MNGSGHGIMSMATPGVTAADPLEGKPKSFERAVLADGFQGVIGTGGGVSTGGGK